MKRIFSLSAALVLTLVFAGTARSEEETLSFGPFGKVFLYHDQPQPAGVVIFISGDGGWNKGVVDMARELVKNGALVAGVDITHYLRKTELPKEACLYPAADLEALSKYIQKRMNFPRYRLPLLVGYSSGAALVYAVLAQSPPNTFRGGISLGFCPSLKLRKPLCRGQGLQAKPGLPGKGELFLPDTKLETPWIVLQGAIDKVCVPDEARSFVREVPEADIVILPKVGHGFAVTRNWMPEFKKAVTRLERGNRTAETPGDALKDLPLVELPAESGTAGFFTVIISGDGGWAGLDREVGGALSRQGIPVAGLNSLQYFWTRRTPEGASEDLARIIRHYLDVWHKRGVVLVGYSLGADVLPFMANRLPADILDRVREIVLLGPGRETEFEFHVSEWLGGSNGKTALPVLPEVEKLRGKRILCAYGSEEKDSLCPDLDRGLAESMRMSGGHHFGGRYESIAAMIRERAAGTR